MNSKSDLIAGWAELIAKDDSHGYSQSSRWGQPDMDCSALCILAAEAAGIPVRTYGATYTGNMASAFAQSGQFEVIPYRKGAVLQRGDILVNTIHHAAVYIGNNKIVEACGDEKGGISGGKPGDQTGHEIHIRNFYNFPWNNILRVKEGTAAVDPINPVNDPDCSYNTGNAIQIYGPQIQYKDYGPAVAAAQGAINYHGFGPVEVNGFFSTKMRDAVRNFQTVKKLEIDGIIGPETWRALMFWR